MIILRLLFTRFLLLFLCVAMVNVQAKDKPKKGDSSWNHSEYNSTRSVKNLRTSFVSKGFSWLSGSPADNEKLSVGKNAQFFGFVALRRDSGRAANRGALGKAFYSIASNEQRAIIGKAAADEAPLIDQWWDVRTAMLRLLETHLYDGQPIDEKKFYQLSREFGYLNGEVVLIEANAFAILEGTLTSEQKKIIVSWRKDPEQAFHYSGLKEIEADIATLSDADAKKKTADLFAKAFSWLTGTLSSTTVIPLGQPAQFFGFVSIRHKSGHGAKRGKITKEFLNVLTKKQEGILDKAVFDATSEDKEFFAVRLKILEKLLLLRSDRKAFDSLVYQDLNRKIGEVEASIALIEARAYRDVRIEMTDQQVKDMMAIRDNYIIDPKQIQSGSIGERGEKLALLCSGCHEFSGRSSVYKIAPSLKGVFGRKIASINGFDYSSALTALNQDNKMWNPESLNQYLKSPKSFAPGTKMEFQGLLIDDDRNALIEYLKKL